MVFMEQGKMFLELYLSEQFIAKRFQNYEDFFKIKKKGG